MSLARISQPQARSISIRHKLSGCVLKKSTACAARYIMNFGENAAGL